MHRHSLMPDDYWQDLTMQVDILFETNLDESISVKPVNPSDLDTHLISETNHPYEAHLRGRMSRCKKRRYRSHNSAEVHDFRAFVPHGDLCVYLEWWGCPRLLHSAGASLSRFTYDTLAQADWSEYSVLDVGYTCADWSNRWRSGDDTPTFTIDPHSWYAHSHSSWKNGRTRYAGNQRAKHTAWINLELKCKWSAMQRKPSSKARCMRMNKNWFEKNLRRKSKNKAKCWTADGPGPCGLWPMETVKGLGPCGLWNREVVKRPVKR